MTESLCHKCGKQKFTKFTTICTAMVRDSRYMEMYCHCVEVLNYQMPSEGRMIERERLAREWLEKQRRRDLWVPSLDVDINSIRLYELLAEYGQASAREQMERDVKIIQSPSDRDFPERWAEYMSNPEESIETFLSYCVRESFSREVGTQEKK